VRGHGRASVGNPGRSVIFADRIVAFDPDPEAITRLPYLEAVCQETLRLKPVAPQVVRMLARPLELKGIMLPAGIGVGISVLLVHRREDLYPEAESFRPERFLERRFAPFEFLPFGGGARLSSNRSTAGAIRVAHD
jgi:cytochrome P450